MRKFLLGFVVGIVAWSGFLTIYGKLIKFEMPHRLPLYPDDDQEWLRTVTRNV